MTGCAAGGTGEKTWCELCHRHLMVGLWQAAAPELQVRVHYLDTFTERAVMMTVGTADFRVRYAEAVSHRESGRQASGRKELPELQGLTAYLGAGKQFRQALRSWTEDALWPELFLEGIKALIQAEYCVAGERGFASEKEYEQFFAEKFAGSCIYYSHPLEFLQPWGVYVGNQARDGCLFMRLRTSRLHLGERWFVTGTMMDSFHELTLEMALDAGAGTVAAAEAHIIRVPDRVCHQAANAVQGLVGRRLAQEDRRELAVLLGGKTGCTHLVDLAADGAALLGLAGSGR